MKEIYKGSDIPKAYPKSDGYWVCTHNREPIQADTLYIVTSTRFTPQYMEVEFLPVKIWTGPTS